MIHASKYPAYSMQAQILYEYEHAIEQGNWKLSSAIRAANPDLATDMDHIVNAYRTRTRGGYAGEEQGHE